MEFNHKENDHFRLNENLIMRKQIYPNLNRISNQNHLIKNNLSGFRLTCDCCDDTFGDFIQLFKHRQTYNSVNSNNINEKYLKKPCFYCPLMLDCTIFHDGYLTIQKENTDLQSTCTFCQTAFLTTKYFHHECYHCNIASITTCKELVNHMKKIHKSATPYRCVPCGSNFSDMVQLKTHIQIHNNVKKTYTCNYCHKQYTRLRFLILHRRTHNIDPYVCNQCDHRFTNFQNINAHKLSYTADLSVCSICNKAYVQHPKSLSNHDNSKIISHKFKCGFCPSTFPTKLDLKYHRYKHTDKKIFKCDLCQKEFLQPYNLKYHMQFHTSKKIYDTELCSKKNLSKTELKQHIPYHSNTFEKRFKCDQCPKAYRRKFELETHIKSIHEIQFKCDQCPETYASKPELEYHKYTHTEKSNEEKNNINEFPKIIYNAEEEEHEEKQQLKCDQCSKSYKTKKALEYHKRIHIGEWKPFKCDQCSKSYTTKYLLVNHKNHTHFEANYPCKMCDKRFTKPAHLRLHQYQSYHI